MWSAAALPAESTASPHEPGWRKPGRQRKLPRLSTRPQALLLLLSFIYIIYYLDGALARRGLLRDNPLEDRNALHHHA